MGFFLCLLALIWHIIFCYRFFKEIIEKIHHKMRRRSFLLIGTGIILLTNMIYAIFFILISYIKIFFSLEAVDKMIYGNSEIFLDIFWLIGAFSIISLLTGIYSYFYLKSKYLL